MDKNSFQNYHKGTWYCVFRTVSDWLFWHYQQAIDKNDLNLRKSLKTFQKCTAQKCVRLNFAYQTMSYFPSELQKGSRRSVFGSKT